MTKRWPARSALLSIALLAGCGSGSTPAAPVSIQSAAPVMPTAKVTLVLNGTPPSTMSLKARRPTFIDTAHAAQLLVTVATVNGASVNTTTSYAITGSVVTCSGSPETCTLSTALPTGLDNLQVTLEDSSNRPLAQNNVSASVVQGTNTVYLTLNPIVAAISSFSIATSEIGFGNGTGYSVHVTFTTTDAAGATITGPGVFGAVSTTTTAARLAPLTISSTDPFTTFSDNNGTAAASVSIASPSDDVRLFHASGSRSNAVLTDSANSKVTASSTTLPQWLYVTVATPAVEIFDAANNTFPYSTTIAQTGAPNGLAFDSSGHLYVADNTNSAVNEYDTGNFNALIATFNGGATLSNPEGVVFQSSTGYLYVANTKTSTVSVFQTPGNTLYTTISGANTLFNGPNGVAIDSSQNLYVANGKASTVTEYATGSMTASAWNPAPTQTYTTSLTTPVGVAVNAGQLYVADSKNNAVYVYNTSTGAQIAAQTIALASAPADLYINSANGLLYVPLNGGTTIQVYQTNTNGTAFTLTTTYTANSAPFGVTMQ